MRKISLLKSVACAAAMSTIAATPIILTSCTFTTPIEELVLDSIEIQLPQNSIRIEKGTNFKTNGKIAVQCYDQNGDTFKSETKLYIWSKVEQNTPNWIWIDKENKINIDGSAPTGTYEFEIFAKDKGGKIKSNERVFLVQIYEHEIYAPDEIELSIGTDEPYAFNGIINIIPINLEVFKPGYDIQYVSRHCEWIVTKILGPQTTDRQGGQLFTATETANGCNLVTTTETDGAWIGDYSVTVKAINVLDQSVSDEITVSIYFRSATYYEDEETGLTYQRLRYGGEWMLFSTKKEDATVINNIKPEVFHAKVTSVRRDFAMMSKSKVITTIILPEYITEIQENAFANMTSLYSLAMPGVKIIGSGAFKNDVNVSLLKNYDKPQLISIGNEAFLNCSSFSLDGNNQFTTIGDSAFANTDTKEIDLGSNVKSIGNQCFSDCPNLSTIQITAPQPPVINGVLFSGTTHLNYIKVPSELVEIYKENENWAPYQEIIVSI